MFAGALATALVLQPTPAPAGSPPDDGKLRIIVFGAHPDDCEFRVGGTAIKWAKLGHHVKFVSVTNGDIGHWKMAGGPLAQRRTAEVKRADEILGVESQVLDIHDGASIMIGGFGGAGTPHNLVQGMMGKGV
ncbi:MAG TPA: hypothetical protein EYP14_20260, partial [Planctomycetaceae bacterium]|nr:hypothetical protein [Planctomycetaceae bacterium]